jgi:hypothetical protein
VVNSRMDFKISSATDSADPTQDKSVKSAESVALFMLPGLINQRAQ